MHVEKGPHKCDTDTLFLFLLRSHAFDLFPLFFTFCFYFLSGTHKVDILGSSVCSWKLAKMFYFHVFLWLKFKKDFESKE